jgi:hypothetical protein
MKVGTKLILIILLMNQFSFGQTNQIDTIPDDTLEIDEDIEIEPLHLSYKEIEKLYFTFKHFKNIPNGVSYFPYLKSYFQEMDKGIHPFEIFVDETFLELHADTSDLRLFMEEIKIEFDKEKKASSEQSIKRQ